MYRKKPDYSLKQRVLLFDEKTNILRIASQYNMLHYIKTFDGTVPYYYNEEYLEFASNYYFSNYKDYWEECQRLNKSKYERTCRLRKKMQVLLTTCQCSFITFTFNDYTLTLDNNYRRLIVQRTLNALDCPYIANVDYGSDDIYTDSSGNVRQATARQHFHAVVGTSITLKDCKPLQEYIFNYGFICVENVRNVSDSCRLAKYVAKLSNHAIKETACRNALLYSRKHKIDTSCLDIQEKSNTAYIGYNDVSIDNLRPLSDSDFDYFRDIGIQLEFKDVDLT